MAKRVKKLAVPNLEEPLTTKLLGQIIKARRTQSELKLEDAAALCGVAKHTFMKIEHGCPSSIESVLKICSGLGIHIFVKPWSNESDNDWQ